MFQKVLGRAPCPCLHGPWDNPVPGGDLLTVGFQGIPSLPPSDLPTSGACWEGACFSCVHFENATLRADLLCAACQGLSPLSLPAVWAATRRGRAGGLGHGEVTGKRPWPALSPGPAKGAGHVAQSRLSGGAHRGSAVLFTPLRHSRLPTPPRGEVAVDPERAWGARLSPPELHLPTPKSSARSPASLGSRGALLPAH